MQLANFEIDSGFTTIVFDGRNLDLHNNFEFALLDYDKVSGIAQVTFNKGTGKWIPNTDPDKLTLVFKNVSRIYQKEHDSEYPADYLQQDGNMVDMIGFSYDGNEIMDGVTDNIPNKELPALLIVFV